MSCPNLLPADGIVHYFGPILEPVDADRYFEILSVEIPWAHDSLVMFGKPVVMARQVAWYGERDFSYTYSGRSKHALPWTAALRELKALVEVCSGETFNSCLLNLYHHGGEGMGWHSDDEKMLGRNSAIGSLSLGAARPFKFRHKRTREPASLLLENGSLLVMKGETQTHWQHELPKAAKIKEPRINLTFRTIVDA